MNKSKEDRIFTIPNMMSMFRLCLVPIIIWEYAVKEQYQLAVILLVISGASDLLDGYIARKFDMITKLGKILDPVADKITQAAMLFCLAFRFPYIGVVFLLMIIKECIVGLSGLLVIKKKNMVIGALWHGKLTTAALYTMIFIHMFWFDIPLNISKVMVGICAGIMIFSLILYGIQNGKLLLHKNENE